MQEGKVVVWGGFTNCWGKKRSDRQGKKREGYTQLNAKFQRIARRDKIFLNEQCNEIKENNTMGKTRDLFKKNMRISGGYFMQGWAW